MIVKEKRKKKGKNVVEGAHHMSWPYCGTISQNHTLQTAFFSRQTLHWKK